MLITQFVRFAAATLLPFIVSKLKNGSARILSTFFRVSSGISLPVKPLTSSMNWLGFAMSFCAVFQSMVFFSFLSRNAQAQATSTHSGGGLPKPFSSPMEFLSRQFTASPAASIAGSASFSSPSASVCSFAATLAIFVVFSSSTLALVFSSAATAKALDTFSMRTAVAAFFSSTWTMVIFKSSFRPSTLFCTCSMMARPLSRRSQLFIT
mmetsp:Transcript_33252/g.87960  ORF Transcript_33252/g.87960 Transcript_33252/m.87960 type:complete len:209 (-) Transcript_33252:9394-10020(-)